MLDWILISTLYRVAPVNWYQLTLERNARLVSSYRRHPVCMYCIERDFSKNSDTQLFARKSSYCRATEWNNVRTYVVVLYIYLKIRHLQYSMKYSITVLWVQYWERRESYFLLDTLEYLGRQNWISESRIAVPLIGTCTCTPSYTA